MSVFSIGEATRRSGLPADTLRYYERIRLLPPVGRTSGGIRRYTDADLARLRFIRRAQHMDFTLGEIRQMIELREKPGSVRGAVRTLTAEKLRQVEARLQSLQLLRAELTLLLNLCTGTKGACPILKSLERAGRAASPRPGSGGRRG